MTPTALDLRTGWPLYLGMSVAGAAAVVASASTLAALARTAGWAGWSPWLLPACLDVGGSVGGWVWLRPETPQRARRTGRIVALAGAGTSLVGNGAGHLITTGYLHPGPALVVIVGAVPAAVLVALAHLAALLTRTEPTDPTTRPHTPNDATPTEPTEHTTKQSEPAEPSEPAEQNEQSEGIGTAEVDTRAAVLAAIRTAPVTVADLVKATGRSRTTVVGHLTALTGDGVITRDGDKRYRPTIRPNNHSNTRTNIVHTIQNTHDIRDVKDSADVEEPVP